METASPPGTITIPPAYVPVPGPPGPPGPAGPAGGVTMYHQEFTPAAFATTVTLSAVPEAVLIVSREGVVQSVGGGHYSVVTDVLTFAASFSGVERVIVSYSVRDAP